MKRWITRDDFVETYGKIRQRGLRFILSKFRLNPRKRTKSSFNEELFVASNWWSIPAVQDRLNEKISGDPGILYEDYVVSKYFSDSKDLKMLSLGSGVCSHELRFAAHSQFSLIHCVDMADKLLNIAKNKAADLGLENMQFSTMDFSDMQLDENAYDVIFFHASLHHFTQIEELIINRLIPAMKPGAHLIIHEYVGPNRIQLRSTQIEHCNRLLNSMPESMRIRRMSSRIKRKLSGPGLLRMWLSDPSEAPESESILPVLHAYLEIREEKALGGNLLAYVLKDIAHHFFELDAEKQRVLSFLFDEEDKFLNTNQSDLVFGVYTK